MFYNRAIKVSSSHNQSYTEIGSVYHGAYLSHILNVPPLRAYSGRGSVLFSFLVYFFYKTSFFFFLLGKHIGLPLLVIYIFRSFVFVSLQGRNNCVRIVIFTLLLLYIFLLSLHSIHKYSNLYHLMEYQ